MTLAPAFAINLVVNIIIGNRLTSYIIVLSSATITNKHYDLILMVFTLRAVKMYIYLLCLLFLWFQSWVGLHI